jgi:hypothetical protein
VIRKSHIVRASSKARACTAAWILGTFVATAAGAQPPAGAPQSPRSARESAPIDPTGQWVAIINEDWRWRMVTPPQGDYTSVLPLNQAGRALADTWDPSQDGSCRAYGAAGLLRMPTRLRIEWASDDALVLQTDAGEQVRRFDFASSAEPAERSLQGFSHATWQRPLSPAGAFGPPPPGPPAPGGSLLVTTTRLVPGWLRRNGVPYGENARLTEYFDRFAAPDGADWLVVTTIVEDPDYLNGRFVTSSHFRREIDRSKWNPRPCKPF